MAIAPELAAAPSAKAPAESAETATQDYSHLPLEVEYGIGTEDDVDDAAYILMRAFEETMMQIFPGGCTPDHQAFRRSQLVSSLLTQQAHSDGTYATPTRFAVARRRDMPQSKGTNGHSTRRVVGFVVWSLEGVATPEAQSKSTFVPPPFGQPPQDADFDRFLAFREAMAGCERKIMGQKPHASVKYLAVDPDVRRSGAGTGLMKLVHRDVQDHDSLPIYLDAAETASAPSFYKRLGFKSLDRVQAPGLSTGTQAMVLEAGEAAHHLLE